jgi:hypothetical protein
MPARKALEGLGGQIDLLGARTSPERTGGAGAALAAERMGRPHT